MPAPPFSQATRTASRTYGSRSPAPKNADPTISIFLGLYLLLLGFFIILNSMSSYADTRTKAVIGSVNSAFNTEDGIGAEAASLAALLSDTLGPRQFQRDISRMFSTGIANAEVTVLKPGRALDIVVPTDEIFDRSSSRILDDRRDILSRVAKALRRHPYHLDYHVEVLLGAGDGAVRRAVTQASLPIDRAGSLARLLIDAGAPERSVAVGVRAFSPAVMHLRFLVRSADEPRLDFAATAG